MGYFRENIEKMTGYAPGFQPNEIDIIKLNTNENPYPPSPKVLESLAKINAKNLRKYPEIKGDTFRRTAAEVFGLKPENFICTNGGDDFLTICIRAFCDKNAALAYPVPTYSLYPILAQLQNCPTVKIPFDDEFNLPAKLASIGAALTIVCNPNAPSGTFVQVEEIAELAGEIKGVLLIDEAYVNFADSSCIGLIKDFDNVIILRSMSKGYSLAGIRFGFGIASENLIAGLMKVKDSYNVDAIAITAATAAIKDRDYFKANVEKIKAERSRLSAELAELGFFVYPSQANFVLAKNDAKNIKAIDIYQKLKEQNIYIRYWAEPGLKDKLRITVGTADENDRLITVLKKIMTKTKE
ncbi:MAG: histidinol-phosphate transaminase [Anaerohalosphaeraceae bacterium]|nr:histidinol-phosphate transaminase [Anaerohalosphaeraceae bacterium]